MEATYQEKFKQLQPWLEQIVRDVKKDLKNDHLKRDVPFLKKYFNKPYHKVEVEDLAKGYQMAVQDGADQVAEFIFQRWLMKHTDIYQFFAQELEKINPDFSQIKEIETARAKEIAKRSAAQFGAKNSYLFTVINSVAFPRDVISDLEKEARHESKEAEKMQSEQMAITSQESLVKSYETKIMRLTDRYEKRLAGLEMKYHTDIEQLKKQIANLQKKIG